MVEELHALLHGAGVAPPLILAGHSLGGYNVRIYQARYPEEIGALVLLDAAHEQQWERLPPQAKALAQASVAGLRKRGEQARAGQLRAEEIAPPGVLATHSPGLRDAYVAAMLTGKPYEAMAAETEASFESARQVPARHRLGNLPLVVLTARRSFDAFKGSGIPVEESNALWLAFQNELASLSDNSQHLFSDGHHRLNETDPDGVVSAIQVAITASVEHGAQQQDFDSGPSSSRDRMPVACRFHGGARNGRTLISATVRVPPCARTVRIPCPCGAMWRLRHAADGPLAARSATRCHTARITTRTTAAGQRPRDSRRQRREKRHCSMGPV
jgi:pimeloyl-ACP methyl ester carboxylesterase